MEPAIWGFLGVVIGAALTGTAAYFGPIRGVRTTAESRMRELEWSARDEEVKQLNELRITAREFVDTLKQARRAQPSERASFSEETQQRSRAVTMAAYRTTSSGATIPSNHLATPRS